MRTPVDEKKCDTLHPQVRDGIARSMVHAKGGGCVVLCRFLSPVPDCPRRLVGCYCARPVDVGSGSRSAVGVCPACALPLRLPTMHSACVGVGRRARRIGGRGRVATLMCLPRMRACIAEYPVRVQVRVCVSVHMLEDEFFFSFFLFME